jgi:hypothetical protein
MTPAPLPGAEEDAALVVQDMQRWVDRAVVGLNLCPFAKAVQVHGRIHYAVSGAREAEVLLEDLAHEMDALLASDPLQRDTTLLMAPWCLADFLDFNDFLGQADALLVQKSLEGEFQIASFHPDYQFADAARDAIGNYSNRAPYPTLHLLREASLDKAVAAFPDAEDIFGRNLQTLERLGAAGWADLGLTRQVAPPVPAAPPPRTLRSRRFRP